MMNLCSCLLHLLFLTDDMLISQMYLSMSRLVSLGSACTIYRPAERTRMRGGPGHVVTHLYAFGDVIWRRYFYSQTFPSARGWSPQSSAVGWRTLAVKHLDTWSILFSHVTIIVKRANSFQAALVSSSLLGPNFEITPRPCSLTVLGKAHLMHMQKKKRILHFFF